MLFVFSELRSRATFKMPEATCSTLRVLRFPRTHNSLTIHFFQEEEEEEEAAHPETMPIIITIIVITLSLAILARALLSKELRSAYCTP